MSIRDEFEKLKAHERHEKMAEARYWLAQYKLFIEDMLNKQAQSGEAVAWRIAGEAHYRYSDDPTCAYLENAIPLFTYSPDQSAKIAELEAKNERLYTQINKNIAAALKHNDKVREIEAKIAELEADKKRLDWMIFHSASIHHSKDGDNCWIKWFDGEELRESTRNFQNAREAIDEAKGDGK